MPKSGFVAILGRPNVGKSSIVNKIVGEKVSIVSPKAQTTRDKIVAIKTTDEYQLVFVDTPGVHAPKNELGEYMMRSVNSAVADVDCIVIVFDCERGISHLDIDLLKKYINTEADLYVVLNKVDLVGYERVYPMIERLNEYMRTESKKGIKEILPTSTKKDINLGKLEEFLVSSLPENEFFYPKDDLTNRPVKFLVGELIREKALLYLQEEIPHGIGVMLQTYEESPTLVRIEADIVCEKASHKSIVIGHNGDMLKVIGEKARMDIEKLLDCKVFLSLYVKVREGWRNDKAVMNDIGYSKNDI